MNVIDTNDPSSHYQLNSSSDHINLNTFADQPLSGVFDCNINSNGNSMNNMNDNSNNMGNAMNNSMNNNSSSMNMFDANQNRILLKHIRNKNTKDFKDLVANFWTPSNNNNSFQQSQMAQPVKNMMTLPSISQRTPSTDAFGNFHPVEVSANKNKNTFTNGKPNATMDMRIPLKNPSSDSALSSNNLAINKNLFRPYRTNSNSNMGSSSIRMNNNMIPPMTQSMSTLASSRRVSVCSSSVISDDSNHSRQSSKQSATAIINAATNIVNGNDLDGLFNMNMNNNMNMNMNNMNMNNMNMNNMNSINMNNMNMNNMNMNMDPIPSNHNHTVNNSNVLSEPGPYDIVCGRNSGAYNYIGNRRFRVTIEMNLQRYIDSPTREDKTNVIKSIVWMLHQQVGARFLKKETSKKSSGSRRRGTPRYTVMTDKQSREKVGHALRDLVITARKEQQEKKQPLEEGPKVGLQQS